MTSFKQFLIIITFFFFITIDNANSDETECRQELSRELGNCQTFNQCYEYAYESTTLKLTGGKDAKQYMIHIFNNIDKSVILSPEAYCHGYRHEQIEKKCLNELKAFKLKTNGKCAFTHVFKEKTIEFYNKTEFAGDYVKTIYKNARPRHGLNPDRWCNIKYAPTAGTSRSSRTLGTSGSSGTNYSGPNIRCFICCSCDELGCIDCGECPDIDCEACFTC